MLAIPFAGDALGKCVPVSTRPHPSGVTPATRLVSEFGGGDMGRFAARYSGFDRFQQRHPGLGFPLAVLQKYSDDQGGYLAATITYYGFFAIFPLLLVLATALGFLLPRHRGLERSVLDSALAQFPVIGPELRSGLLHGSAVALT